MSRVVEGEVRVERGYVRPEDESAVPEPELEGEAESNGIEAVSPQGTKAQGTGSPVPEEREEEEEQGIKPIPRSVDDRTHGVSHACLARCAVSGP
jgi:hypothetical protein